MSGFLHFLSRMRFEDKHKFFKDIANNNKCRVNIVNTLAKRHQMNYIDIFLDNMTPKILKYGTLFPFNASKYNLAEVAVLLKDVTDCVSAKWVEINNLIYKKTQYLLLYL